MQSVLRFYTTEKQIHEGKPLSEWLLEHARVMGIPGGSVYRAVAGYGRHGHLHQETFFELGGELPLQIEFVVDDALGDRLLHSLSGLRLQLFYVRHTAQSGIV